MGKSVTRSADADVKSPANLLHWMLSSVMYAFSCRLGQAVNWSKSCGFMSSSQTQANMAAGMT
jgi:hypothetical protein